jgi:uncharacterized iron-regulated protein
MKKFILISISLIIIFSAYALAKKASVSRIYDIQDGRAAPITEMVPTLSQNRIVIVGEHHNNKSHHEAQLKVIRTFKEAGIEVAAGLEMFRSDSQEALDRWVAGEIGEAEFEQIFYDNWGYSWENYRVIFDYARQEKVPLIGLNVPREITRQVASRGFKSLSAEQRGKLSNIACRVDKEYMEYIKRAYGGHAHGKLNFTYFCEAQLVWDAVMAVNTLDYLKKNPTSLVVILTGTGHAQKNAIPRQIKERSDLAHAVILPEVKGFIDPQTIDKSDADYIMLDL